MQASMSRALEVMLSTAYTVHQQAVQPPRIYPNFMSFYTRPPAGLQVRHQVLHHQPVPGEVPGQHSRPGVCRVYRQRRQ
jgi:hypothetical protein